MKAPSKLVILTAIHFLVLAALIVTVWIQVHWSVAILCAWMAFTISGFATHMRKSRAKLQVQIKELNDRQKHTVSQFNEFVATINNQAAEVKKEMSVCRECEKHPGMVRPGSMHNFAADNCAVKPIVAGTRQMQQQTTLKPVSNRPKCEQCISEGHTTTEYLEGNCPIHD